MNQKLVSYSKSLGDSSKPLDMDFIKEAIMVEAKKKYSTEAKQEEYYNERLKEAEGLAIGRPIWLQKIHESVDSKHAAGKQ